MLARPTIFDFNGVLVDDEHVHFEAFRDVLAVEGIDLDEARYTDRYLGFDDAGAFRAILADAGHAPSEPRVAALIEAKKPAYLSRIERSLRVFPDAASVLRRRAALSTVAIVSGALRHEIDHCLGRMGVAEAVAFIIAAEDTRACKPDPEGYLLAKSRLGPAGARAVVIEDSLAGVEAAKAAGLRCVAVAHSYAEDRLRAAGADAVFAAIADVTDAALEGDA
jgi:beta-phosphoglucomutase